MAEGVTILPIHNKGTGHISVKVVREDVYASLPYILTLIHTSDAADGNKCKAYYMVIVNGITVIVSGRLSSIIPISSVSVLVCLKRR